MNKAKMKSNLVLNTFLELIKSRPVFYSSLAGVILICAGRWVGGMTPSDPVKPMIDFGFAGILLSSCSIAVLVSPSLWRKKIKTQNTLRQISGKLSGLSGVLFLNWLLLSSLFLGLLKGSLGGNEVISAALFEGLYFGLIQSLMMASVSAVISSLLPAYLAIPKSIAFYLISTNLSFLRVWLVQILPGLKSFIYILTAVIPNLEYFNFSTKLAYGLPTSWKFSIAVWIYSGVVMALYLFVTQLIVRNPEA
jgi:hypothetical protein